MYRIYKTDEYSNRFKGLDKAIQMEVDRAVEKLGHDPFIGKPLGYKFFREKKIGKFRLYFLIYEEYVIVSLIAISNKKDQQDTINKIKKLIPGYREEVKKMFFSKA